MPGEDLHGLIRSMAIRPNPARSAGGVDETVSAGAARARDSAGESNGIAQWLKLSLAADEAEVAAGLRRGWISCCRRDSCGRVPRGAGPRGGAGDFAVRRIASGVATDALVADGDRRAGVPAARTLPGRGRRSAQALPVVGRLADLFDQYQVYRADWLAAWAAGERAHRCPRHATPAAGGPALAGRCGAGCATTWPPARVGWCSGGVPKCIAPFSARRRAGACAASAGIAAAGAGVRHQFVATPVARSAGCDGAVVAGADVRANPCRHFWADIVSGQDLLRRRRPHQAAKAGRPELLSEDHAAPACPSAACRLGQAGGDYIACSTSTTTGGAGRHAGRSAHWASGSTCSSDKTGATVLEQLQQDILDLVPMAEIRERAATIDPARDASLRFHIAHSRQREVEILHDQLLAAFNADAGLRPRDVIVMVPDIDAYAPHIEAVFGLLPADDPRSSPSAWPTAAVAVSIRWINALETLLGLPQSRLAVSVLDLLEVPALRRRFGIGTTTFQCCTAGFAGPTSAGA